MLPYENFDPLALHTCLDGRCMMNGLCMTAFQCSAGYVKAGGFGTFCVSDTAFADSAMQTAIKLHSNICPPGSIMCLGGQCRASIYDCPQETTCPASLPIMCRDGQCKTSSDACATVDDTVFNSLQTCLEQGLLLCESDLVTCAESQHLCPTLSTCPFGFLKCSESKCINPLTE